MRTGAPLFLMLGLLLGLYGGCASIHTPKTMRQGDVSAQLKKRNEEFAKEFETQRDFAEYEAAKACWVQLRDPKGSREGLEKLLSRKPQHREARLLLAELMLAEEDAQAAYDQAKAALDAYPNDAQMHYTMALTLDALGNSSDALGYYDRATRMDPSSEAYAAAYRTASEATREETRHLKATTIGIADPVADPAAEAVPASYATSTPGTPKRTERADWRSPAVSADPAGQGGAIRLPS